LAAKGRNTRTSFPPAPENFENPLARESKVPKVVGRNYTAVKRSMSSFNIFSTKKNPRSGVRLRVFIFEKNIGNFFPCNGR